MDIVAESVKNDGEAVRSVRRLNDRRGKHEEEELLLGMNLTRLRTAASSLETANVSASHQRQDFAGEDDDNNDKFTNKNDGDTNNFHHLLHLSAVAYCPINQILIVHGGYAKPPLSSSMPDALVVSSQKGTRTTQIEAKQEERSPLLGGDQGKSSINGEEKPTVTMDSVLIKSLSKRKNTSTKRARHQASDEQEEKEDGKNVDDDPAGHQVHTVSSSDDDEDNDGNRHAKKGSSARMASGTARQEQGEQKKEYTPRPHGHLYALEVKTGRWHDLSSSYPPFSFSPSMTSPSRASFGKKGGRDEKEENKEDFCDAKSVDALSVCHPSSGSNRNLFTSSSSSPQPLHSHVGFFTNGGETFVVHGGLSQLSSPVAPTIENEGGKRRVGGGRGSRRKVFPQSSSALTTQIISNETYAYHWRRGHWERLTHLFGGDEAPRMYGHAVLPLLLLPKTSSSSSFSAFSPSSDNAEKAADFSQHLLYPSLSSSSSSSSTSSDATSFIVVGSVSSSSSSFLTPTPSGGSSDRYITSMGKKSDRGRGGGETTNQRVIGGVQRRRVDGGDNPSRPRPRPRRDLQQERQLAMAVYVIDLNRNGGKVWRRIAIDEDHRHLYNSNKDNTSVRGGGFVVKFPNRRYFIVAPAAPAFYSSSKDGDCDVDGYQLFDFFLVGGVASSFSSRSSSFSYESDKGVFFDNDNGTLSYIRDEHYNQRHLSTTLGLGGKAQCSSSSYSSFVYLQDCYHFNARTGRWTEIVDFAGVPRGLCIGSRGGSGGCGIIIEPTTQCDGTKEESGRVRGRGTIFSTAAAAAVETNEKKMKKSMGSTATDTQTAKSSSASRMVREIDDNNDDGIALVRGRVLLFHAPPPPPPPSLLPPVSVSDNDNDDATVPQPSHHSRSAAPASSSFVGSSGGGGGGSGDEVSSLRGTLTFINAKERVVLNLDKLPLYLPLLSKEEEGTQLHQCRQKKTRGEDGEVGLVVEEKREAVGAVRSQHVHRREQEQDALGNGVFSSSDAAHHTDFAAATAAAPSSSLVPPSSVQFSGFGNAMLRKAAFEKINTAKKEEEKEEKDYDDFDYDKNDRRRNFSRRSGKRQQLFLFGGGGGRGRGRENKNHHHHHHHDPNNNPNPLFAALAAVSLETRRKQLSERIARLSKYLDEDDDDNIRRDDDDDNNNNGVSGGKRERDDEVGWWAAAAKIEKERQERYLEKAYAIANAVSRFSHTCSINNTTTGTSTTSAALEEEGRGGDTLSKHDHHHHLIGSNNHDDDDDDDENKTLLEAFFSGGSGGNKDKPKGLSEEEKQSLVIPSVSSLLLNFLYITATTAPKPMAPLNPLTLTPITAATNDNDNSSTQQSPTSTTYSAHHPRSPRSRGIGLWYEFEVLTLLLMTSSSSSSPNNNNNSSASSSSSGARRKRRTNTGIKRIGYTSTEACVGKVTFALGDAWATTNTDGTENKITTTNTTTAKGAKDNAEGDVRDLEEKIVPSADPKTAAAAAMELAQEQRPQYRATEENPHRFSSEMHHPLLTPPNNNEEEEEEENFLLDVGDLFGSTAATAAQTTTTTTTTTTVTVVVPEDSDEMGERENEDEIGGPSAHPSSSHALLGGESCNYAGAHDGAVGNREDDDDENVLIDVEDLFGEDDVGAVAVDKDEETYGHKNDKNNNNEEMNHDETTIIISETCSGPPLPFLPTSTSSTPPLPFLPTSTSSTPSFSTSTSLAHLREERKSTSTVATSSTTRRTTTTTTATKQHDFAARNSVGNMVAGRSSVLAADTEDNEDIGAQFEFD